MSGWKAEKDPQGELLAGVLIAAAFGLCLLIVAFVEWPVLATSTLRGDPTLMEPTDAIAGVVRWIVGADPSPLTAPTWSGYRAALPSPAGLIALDALLLMFLMLVAFGGYARIDRWRGRREMSVPWWHPRSRVKARAWARPRDLLHLQPVTDYTSRTRFLRNAALRILRGEGPAEFTADSWGLGRIRGARLRSVPESHLMVVAPTRAGKTTRVLIPEVLRSEGPAIVLSNKTDVLEATIDDRSHVGPVWIFAPMTRLWRTTSGWTPLDGCEDWDYALSMGGWLLDADPHSTQASDNAGARFYNHEAKSVVLPPLLHAAALSGAHMGQVLDWARADARSLDKPANILREAGATQAVAALKGLQLLDERPRSLTMMSASQLVDAYRFPSMREVDRKDFDPKAFNEGTLYLIAPEAEQDILAPVFGALIASTLREWERRSATAEKPPALRILADEAAHLAPLAKLPTYLAVSAGWNVRWCLIYQSLAQVRERYGPSADTVLANVLAKLFMGPIQDETTRRYLVDLLDDETVMERTWAAGSIAETSRHERRASKASAQRLMQLAVGQAVLVHGRDLPAITHLDGYWETGR